jgi:hypothetical protein
VEMASMTVIAKEGEMVSKMEIMKVTERRGNREN